MVRIGEKIRQLRRSRGISQEVLAGALGVSFQSVSKWENDLTMPDVALVPAIAAFFDVSTDELFDYDRVRTAREVDAIVDEHSRWYDTDRIKCEAVLREGLRRFPGNEVLLNCLVGVIPVPERAGEVIELCRALVESAHTDETRIDAWRIMAEAYVSLGEQALAREAIEHIPEIYFTKLGVAARLLTGEERFRAAARQANLSLSELLDMLDILTEHFDACGEPEKAAVKRRQARDVLRAFAEDFPTPYTKAACDAYKGRYDS